MALGFAHEHAKACVVVEARDALNQPGEAFGCSAMILSKQSNQRKYMTPAEFNALVKEMTERKIANEKEDSDWEGRIRGLQADMKSGRKDLEQKLKQ